MRRVAGKNRAKVKAFFDGKVSKNSPGVTFLNIFLLDLSKLNNPGVKIQGGTPFTLKKTLPILSQVKTCAATSKTPAINAKFDINVDVDIDTVVDYGFGIEAKLAPPTVLDFGYYAYALFPLTPRFYSDRFLSSAISGKADATFKIEAGVEANFDTGLIPIPALHVPLSPLTIPG